MNLRRIGVLVLAVVLLPEVPAKAQESEPGLEGGTRYCISTKRIRHTRIVDDNRVLFYLSGKTILLNVLRKECPGLAAYGRFAFTTTTGRICEGDGMAPMDSDPWGHVRPIPRCWLGIHQEITRAEADALMELKKGIPEMDPRPSSLPMPDPSEVGVEEEKEPE